MYEKILNSAALILSVVNGVMLLFFYLRDKPKLVVSPVLSDVYQWWFKLSDGLYNNQTTRRIGFFVYISISNKGLRDVSLASWHLQIKTRNLSSFEAIPHSIPEPSFKLGETESSKILSVLGVRGVFHNGETLIKSGTSIGGVAYYIMESRGSDAWDPLIENNKIKTTMIIKDVFDKKSTCEIIFNQKTIEEIEKLHPDLLKIK